MRKENLLKKCEEMNSKIEMIRKNPLKPVVENLLKIESNRIEKIRNIAVVSKYDIYFIGATGEGKSTAISHLFGLIEEDLLKEKGRVFD